jgi:hypothetical protein
MATGCDVANLLSVRLARPRGQQTHTQQQMAQMVLSSASFRSVLSPPAWL